MIAIVPVSHHIEPAVDEALRELECRGVHVWRRYGWSAIDQGRSVLAYKAIYEAQADAIMWIDADVAFDPNDVFKLEAHNLPFVCGIYPVKGWPVLTSRFANGDPVTLGKGGGLRELEFAAGGFCYIKAEVYRKMVRLFNHRIVMVWGNQPCYPWYLPFLDRAGRNWLGEDYAFSARARRVGCPPMADTTIRLEHIGRAPYGWEYLKAGPPEKVHSVTLDTKQTGYDAERRSS